MPAIPDDTLDRWIRETAPCGDLTCSTLGLDRQPGRATFTAREPLVVCGSEEAARIFEKCGAGARILRASGEDAAPGDALLAAEGPAGALHTAWKVSINVLEYASGIATRTRRLVEIAREGAPGVQIAATCKTFPGTRELSAKSVLAGGGILHRLGLSETILVFDHHRAFFADLGTFLRQIPAGKRNACEKKFIVEAETAAQALALAEAGADGIQFDKMPAAELAENVRTLRALRPDILLIAAGGITGHNAAALAATGVDVLATSAVYFGKPADIAVEIRPR